MSRKIQQPNLEEQRTLESIIDNKSDIVIVKNKKYKIKWLYAKTRQKITSIVLQEGHDDTQSCKCAAAITLNGFWKLKLFYWIRWRWFYYIKQYGEQELTSLFATAKKKVPVDDYYANTILLTGLKDTNMMMKKTEVATILAAQNTEHPTK